MKLYSSSILQEISNKKSPQHCRKLASTKVYSEPCRAFKMELLAKIVNNWKPLTIAAKDSVSNVLNMSLLYMCFLHFFLHLLRSYSHRNSKFLKAFDAKDLKILYPKNVSEWLWVSATSIKVSKNILVHKILNIFSMYWK